MLASIALAQALPELRARESSLRALAAAEGITYDVAAFGGVRTQADTTRILTYRDNDYAVYVAKARANGKVPVSKDEYRPIAPFGSSFHNYGAAFDAEITGAPKGVTFDAALSRLGALGAKAGLVWGGVWARPKTDRPHFQLAYGLAQVRDMWQQHVNGHTPTAPASNAAIAAGLTIPGVQVIASAMPRADAAGPHVASVPGVVGMIQRHPLATTAVSTGAVVVAALLAWVIVRRVTE